MGGRAGRGGAGRGMKRWRVDGSVDACMSMGDAPKSAKREEGGTVLTFSAILPSVVVGSSVFGCSLGRAAGGVPGFRASTSGTTASGTGRGASGM
jgi:hypothetical protein